MNFKNRLSPPRRATSNRSPNEPGFLHWFWNSIKFPFFRPNLERILLLVIGVLHVWRIIYFISTGSFNATILKAEWAFGTRIAIPVLPLATWPVVGWYLALGIFIGGLIIANSRTFREGDAQISNFTWRPMAYAFELGLLVMLFSPFAV